MIPDIKLMWPHIIFVGRTTDVTKLFANHIPMLIHSIEHRISASKENQKAIVNANIKNLKIILQMNNGITICDLLMPNRVTRLRSAVTGYHSKTQKRYQE